MRRAAAIACVDDAVTSFPEGYDTIVGERGVTLSGGQKQRVAIARMLMQQAPVMIFDDSLSAVDAETDEKIRTALRRSTGNATVLLLLISHRVTTLMQADRILVLDGGRVAALGTHAQLVEKPGISRDIYNIQMQSADRARCWRKGGANMAAIDEKEYTQSFDWKIWKRLGPFLRPLSGGRLQCPCWCSTASALWWTWSLPLFQKYAIQEFYRKRTP